jgi:hypothetical protein
VSQGPPRHGIPGAGTAAPNTSRTPAGPYGYSPTDGREAPPRYAHKTGELEGVENDVGIFLLPGRTFALAVLVEGDVGPAAAPVSEALRAICGFYANADGR